MATITRFANVREIEGEREEISWAELFARFSAPKSFKGNTEHPAWSPATFEPCRRTAANVTQISAACLDYDGGETLGEVAATWNSAFGLIYTTRRHTPQNPKFRVILPWLRPISVAQHEKLWLKLQSHTGGKLDSHSKDPARIWYEPGVVEAQFFEVRFLEGAVLNPDEWLLHA